MTNSKKTLPSKSYIFYLKNMNNLFIYLPLLCLLVFVKQISSDSNCGYQSCTGWSNDPDTLNVHLVSHTHDDVGWLVIEGLLIWLTVN